MSTLVEIEEAVTSLPSSQQENLLRWLQTKLANNSGRVSPAPADTRAWLSRLAKLRERGRTNCAGTPLQKMMDELRGE
jgi:hypothetical protein